MTERAARRQRVGTGPGPAASMTVEATARPAAARQGATDRHLAWPVVPGDQLGSRATVTAFQVEEAASDI